ncbi:hypothetical protein Tco_1374006, partial [Tanacetum coccineum]
MQEKEKSLRKIESRYCAKPEIVTIHTKLIDYSLVNSFRRNPRSGVEEFQLDNLSRLVSTITLSSAVDRYVWSLENSGEFSVKSIRQVIDANCFPVIHSATRWVKSVPLKVDVSSYEEWYTWLVSLRLQANLQAVFEGIFYCLWWSVWMFRNKILFEKDTPSQARIFDNIVSNSYYW